MAKFLVTQVYSSTQNLAGILLNLARILQGSCKNLTRINARILQGSCKNLTRILLQESYKDLAKILQGSFKNLTRILQQSYKDLPRILHDLAGILQDLERILRQYFYKKMFKKCMVQTIARL